jgi:hypothetical protein
MLDRKIFLDLSKITSAKVGRKTNDPKTDPHLILGGVNIQQQHAVFETDANGTRLKPSSEKASESIWVNGKRLKGTNGVMLQPNDRIVFG